MEHLTYDVRDGIAYITFNRPDKLNAVTDDMGFAFREYMFQVDEDPDVHAAIISGNGRAFCAGADVKQRQLRPLEELKKQGRPSARGSSLSEAFFGFSHWKPVIAAIHGYALGAGVSLALRSDLVIASPSAQFQVTEVSRGLDSTRFWTFLNYLGGGAFATDVCITGRFFDAAEAYDKGLVTRVVEEGQHVAEAVKIAEHLATLPPLAVRSVVRNRRLAIEEVQAQANGRATQGLHLSNDFRESARAFVEKREPGAFEGS